MLPLVINSDPNRLIQVTMAGSVGTGGANYRQDVVFIQTLLNLVPEANGGPSKPLKVDGLAGPQTIAAIQRFQKAKTRFADGRIDVNGPTVKALVTYLHERRLLPARMPNLGVPHHDIVRGLSGIASPNYRAPAKSSNFASVSASAKLLVSTKTPQSYTAGYHGSTGWKITTSSSVDASILVASVTSINLHMTHDIEPGLNYILHFFGPGVGLSRFPAGFNESTTAMPSWGTELWPVSRFAKLPPIYASDLVMPACILSISAGLTNGWSGSCIFLGSIVPMEDVAHYMAALTGMQVGSPNVGITFYAGAITSWL